MAGYSATPLVKKLGIKSGFDVALINAPAGFSSELDLPSDVTINCSVNRSCSGFGGTRRFARSMKFGPV